MVEAEEPPWYRALGTDAVSVMRKKLDAVRHGVDRWERLSSSNVYEVAAA